MGSDLSISGANNAGMERTEWAAPRVEIDVAKTNRRSSSVSPSIHSMKKLKHAELTGSHFSVGEQQLIKIIERANKAAQGVTTSFRFSIHEGTKEIMVKVLDEETGEVIREIPSEKVLDMVAKFWEMSGIMVDERR